MTMDVDDIEKKKGIFDWFLQQKFNCKQPL